MRTGRDPRVAGLALLGVLLLLTLSSVLACAMPGPREPLAQEQVFQSADLRHVQAVLAEAAQNLSWPEKLLTRCDLPGRALEASPGGDSPTQHLTVSLMGAPDTPTLLERLEQLGLPRGLFHGREAIISRPGDPLPVAAQADSPPSAPPSPHDLVVWRCGPYVLAAEDSSGGGQGFALAEVLHAAAETHNLCGLPASLVLLAHTTDLPIEETMPPYQQMADAANRYYGANAYGRVDFGFTFLDADGPSGPRDAFAAGADLEAFRGHEQAFGRTALREALAGADLPPDAYLERAVVVGPRCLVPSTCWLAPDDYIAVAGRRGMSRVHVENLVVVTVGDPLGTWVHELGHTLHSRYPSRLGFQRLADRYGERVEGPDCAPVGDWDLMASGNLRGNPLGSAPRHMSSYSKAAAGWLRALPATCGQQYVLDALEYQHIGDAVLQLDDPLRDDPRSYYLIEARDAGAPFGAPDTGVVIYHVTHDAADGRDAVNVIRPTQGGHPGPRATLGHLHQPDAATDYVNAAAGFRVRLLAETLDPYRAIIRIDCVQATRE